MLRRLALFAIVVVAGCGDPEQLPPPGVQGPIVMHQWRDDGRPPLVVVARELIQGDAGLSRLDLEAVLVRMPFQGGTLFIAAPRARYERSAERMQVRLEGDQRARLKISGELGGEPLIGTAAEAWYDDIDKTLILERVELYVGGGSEIHKHVRVISDQTLNFRGKASHDVPPPGLATVLAALPRPLVYPEFKRGDFSE